MARRETYKDRMAPMTQQQCYLHVERMNNAPHVFAGFVTHNSQGVVVFCGFTPNHGVAEVDRDGLVASPEQIGMLLAAGAQDMRLQRYRP